MYTYLLDMIYVIHIYLFLQFYHVCFCSDNVHLSYSSKPNENNEIEYYNNTLYFFSCNVSDSLSQTWKISDTNLITISFSTPSGQLIVEGSATIIVETLINNGISIDVISYMWFNSANYTDITSVTCESSDISRNVTFMRAGMYIHALQ